MSLPKLDPIAPHRLDMQLAVLKVIENRIQGEITQGEYERSQQLECRSAPMYADHAPGWFIGDSHIIERQVYSDGIWLVTRIPPDNHLCVYQVIVREQGGAPSTVLARFAFDGDAAR